MKTIPVTTRQQRSTKPISIEKEERVADALRKAGLKDIEVIEIRAGIVKLSCPSYADFLVCRHELRRVGLEAVKI